MNKNELDPEWVESQLRDAQWLTSSASSGGTNCVQVAFLDQGIVALRDSKNPNRAPHLFTDSEYDAFISGIQNGELRRR
ncbi:DUF397 domain-containing protein [Streptomyces luteolus]|uniref:DUF397 domain-containing protein n=1 Tax=Streptomyces luteolus TaxID=3043615 RepID=A0ABT6T7L7_9ACTN|nr:DUF397 domain-containing protein [Streptomyces sp. B-S-A12]MDI3423370.1 DUF397 domain-containing protein [Streptomyces sp. B-S-A12]